VVLLYPTIFRLETCLVSDGDSNYSCLDNSSSINSSQSVQISILLQSVEGPKTKCDLTSLLKAVNGWKNLQQELIQRSLTVQFSAKVNANPVYAMITLSNSTQAIFGDKPIAVRFSPGGIVDVLNGSKWTADEQIRYGIGLWYDVIIEASMVSRTYSVYIGGCRASKVQLVKSASFRDGTEAISTISQISLWSNGAGVIEIANISWNGGSNNPTPVHTPKFTALLADDLSSYSIGQTYPGWVGSSIITDRAPGGQRAVRILLATNKPPACGGSVHYGGRKSLPSNIPISKTIWFSHKRYHPSTQTFGYCYTSSDYNEAIACGKKDNSDGNAWLKDVVFSPAEGGSRIYFQSRQNRRQVGLTAGCRLISEHGPLYNDERAPMYPLDQWFTLQVMVRVGDDGTGKIMAWINDTLINEVSGANVSPGNALAEWGIGPYWNGIPYTDGTPGREEFFVKDFILASDIDGYEAPTGIDSLGNTYIDPATTASELSM
jgi:hypothetical protein